MRDYDLLATFERDGFTVIVDKTYEDLSLEQCFDTSIDPESGLPYYDVKDMYRKIDNGTYEWFMLRVRVMVEDMELGSHYLGGCLYEDPKEVLTDGTAEDGIYEALREAKAQVYRLSRKFTELSNAIDAEGVAL